MVRGRLADSVAPSAAARDRRSAANLIATFVERADEPASRATIGASYRFEAVRTPHGWRLSRVSVSPVWNG